MRIGIISDIHGNFINLMSFFNSVNTLGIDMIICLGDSFNYYPDNLKVIKLIMEKDIVCLMGNHEDYYINPDLLSLSQKRSYNFDVSLLSNHEIMNYIKTLPKYYEISINNQLILFCHASPSDYLHKYIYSTTDLSEFDKIKYDYVFFGHTHRQFLRHYNSKVFCNVGSIGLPRDDGSLMSFAVLDTTKMEIILYRKKINIKRVINFYGRTVNNDVIDLLSRKEIINYNFELLHE